MKKAFQHGLLFLATLILLLHSFFPHEHQLENKARASITKEGCQHATSHSLLEIAEHVFSHNAGIEHLEHLAAPSSVHFEKTTSTPFLFSFFYKNDKSKLNTDVAQTFLPVYSFLLRAQCFSKSYSLRAP